jgi:hypothetical protein|eukprot:SAG25_NODE_3185_length_1182_cov_1.818098_1_plen_38_part_00
MSRAGALAFAEAIRANQTLAALNLEVSADNEAGGAGR